MSEPRVIDAPVPLLEEGQRLDRVEFERRYEAMPHVKKAELIEGVVHMPSPVLHDAHGNQHGILMWWLNCYRMWTSGVDSSDNATVRLDAANEPQPDAVLFVRPECGGNVRMEDGYIAEAPELAVEISYSRAALDLGPRLRVYQANGVREYVVWRTDTNTLHWFVLRAGRYEPHLPDETGIYRSEVFAGLWLDGPALLRLDMQRVFATLQRGIASPEHADFVTRLLQRRESSPLA